MSRSVQISSVVQRGQCREDVVSTLGAGSRAAAFRSSCRRDKVD